MPKGPITRDEYWEQYRKNWGKKNPEKIIKYRETTYINFLRRRGYTIIPPKEEETNG